MARDAAHADELIIRRAQARLRSLRPQGLVWSLPPLTEALMFVRSLLAISVLALTACGGGDDGGGTPDAARVDAPTATVVTVTCPATVAETITTQALSFDKPNVTISRGAIVKFVSTSTHPIGPFPGGQMTDPGIIVPEGQTRCLMFTATGTFKFICTVHSYLGTITVN